MAPSHYVAIRSSRAIHVDCCFCFSFDLCNCNGRQFDASLIAALENIENLGKNRGGSFGTFTFRTDSKPEDELLKPRGN